MTQHDVHSKHSRSAIISELACIQGEISELQSRVSRLIRDLSTTTVISRTPLSASEVERLKRVMETKGPILEVGDLDLFSAERNAPAAQAATPADIQPQAQSEGEPVQVGKASDEVPVRGAGEGHRAGQSEELRHDAEAGGESAASADTASAPDGRKKRERKPSPKPADPIVSAARPPSVQADGGGLVQDGGSTGETRGDQVLNLWAETTLSQDEIAAKLKVNSGTPSAYLSTARRQSDPRALKGDLARAALRPPRHEMPDGRPAIINLDTGQITGAAGSWTADRAVAKAIKREAAGKIALAKISRESAEKAEAHTQAHAREAERLAPMAQRAQTVRRQNELVAEARLARAMELAAATPHPVSLSAKEQRRLAKEQEKRDRLAQQGQAQRRRDEKAAGVDHDPRTAAGQREIQIRGPAVDKRASLADYANLIHRQTDRTPPRLLALERFDQLWHRAHCGLMATPRYERGVDTSRKIAGVPDDRAESLHLIDGVKARIGEEMFAILFHRVINGHSFAWMAGQGMGESERLGVLFLAAIDATARHFGLRERSRAVEAMEQQVSAA